jgi:hypothetical protein
MDEHVFAGGLHPWYASVLGFGNRYCWYGSQKIGTHKKSVGSYWWQGNSTDGSIDDELQRRGAVTLRYGGEHAAGKATGEAIAEESGWGSLGASAPVRTIPLGYIWPPRRWQDQQLAERGAGWGRGAVRRSREGPHARRGRQAAARSMGAHDMTAAGWGLGAPLPEGVGRLAQLRGPSSALCVEQGWKRNKNISNWLFSFFLL